MTRHSWWSALKAIKEVKSSWSELVHSRQRRHFCMLIPTRHTLAHKYWKDRVSTLPGRILTRASTLVTSNLGGPGGIGEDRQLDLPKLPIPELEKTMTRYLESIEPLVSPSQFAEAKTLAKALVEEQGPEIQLHLHERRMKEKNWAYEWWINDMYLSNPICLPINSNPGAVWPPEKFSSVDDQLIFASKIITFFLDFKDVLLKGDYPIEVAGSREPGQPFCMDQFYRLTSSYRVPGILTDQLRDTSTTFVDHIVVGYKNNFYSCPIRSVERRLSTKEIFNQLKLIINSGDNDDTVNDTPVGILSSQQRPIWADLRKKLLAEDDINKQSAEEIETCHFLLCLEDGLPKEPFNTKISWVKSGHVVNGRDDTNIFHQMLHGGGSKFNTGNRWFDKTLQFIVSSDGAVGICYEHSPAEGIGILNLTDDFYKKLKSGDLEPKEKEELSPANVPPPLKLEWVLSEEMKNSIRDASVAIDRSIGESDFVIYRYQKYGKGFIKKCKVSPDIYLQLALQLTYFSIHGKMVATYESCSTRRYKYGRVDTIRTNTREVKDWLITMLDKNSNIETKMKSFRMAVEKSTEIMVENILGEGIDVHLLGIREQAKILGLSVPLLEHETFKIANYFALSTSQLPTKVDQFMGYGAVVHDGYGVSYNPKESSIVFCAASFRSCQETSTENFIKVLTSSLDLMQKLFESS